MSREFEDLKGSIIEMSTAIEGLSLVADSLGMKGGDTQVCLNFTANILWQIHSDLEKKYGALLEAANQGNAPVPLHSA